MVEFTRRVYSFFRLMATSSLKQQKNKYRITLELDVNEDFNPHQINWNKLFELEHNENVKSYVEDLNVRW